jgi:O-antigen/teichoic acid export membrane protein
VINKQRRKNLMKNLSYIILALGIATCLIGAYIMAFGEPIIGADHAGIATVLGITGIGLIGTGNTLSFAVKRKEEP